MVFPSLVLRKIFGFLDRKSQKTVRLVCLQWLHELEEEVGLSVVVTGDESNMNFLQSVLVTRVLVRHLDKNTPFRLKDPAALQVLKCTGLLNAEWFRETVLLKCRFLNKLVLAGPFLFCRSLGRCHGGQRSPAVLPNLSSLDILIQDKEIDELVEAKYRLLGLDGRYTDTDISFMRLSDDNDIRYMIQHNMRFLLSRIRSQRLAAFQISLSETGLRSRTDTYGVWKDKALERFLTAHNGTLRWLYLPGFFAPAFSMLGTKGTLPPSRQPPKQLQALQLDLLFYPESGDRPQETPVFWKALMHEQNCLEEIHFRFFGYPIPRLLALLSDMVLQNWSTLKRIHVACEYYSVEIDQGLVDSIHDANIFSQCRQLERFFLGSLSPVWVNMGQATMLQHFHTLPRSLLEIDVSGVQVRHVAWDVFKRFQSLRRLQLRWLIMEDELTLSRCICSVLRLRHLDYLGINFEVTGCLELEGRLKDLLDALSGISGRRHFSYNWLFVGRPYEYLKPWPYQESDFYAHRENAGLLSNRGCHGTPYYDYCIPNSETRLEDICSEVNLPKYFPLMLEPPLYYHSS